MKNKIVQLFSRVLLLFLLLGTANVASAQCPMCKMSAESNLQNGGTDGRGLNAGIMYMLLLPYLMVGGIGYWWWRNRRQETIQATDFSEEDFQQYPQ